MIRMTRNTQSGLALFVFLPIILFVWAGSAPAAPAGIPAPPVVDREAAEQSFLSAYGYFLENRLWDCLDRLQDAQRQNTYFIDTYYLKSLAMRRLGRYPDAIEAIKAYLEVRPSDYRARIIRRTMEEEWRILREMPYPTRLLSNFVFRGHSLNSLFAIPALHPLTYSGMTGLGKISASGSCLYVPDTLGGNLRVFDASGKTPLMQMPVDSPVAAIPLSPRDILLVQKSGDVSLIRVDRSAHTLAASVVGHVEAGVSDAAAVNATLLAIADRTGGAVKFRRLPSLEAVAEWRPADTGAKLFEPVALAVSGPLLAVADRGNGMVYVLDSYTLAARDRFAVEMPRDLEWGNQGELYILTESGELYARFPVEEKNTSLHRAVDGMKQAWTMTWTDDGPLVADVSGRRWWNSGIYPGNGAAMGTMMLMDPWIEGDKGEETLFLRGRLSPLTYRGLMSAGAPISDAVWRNEVRSSRITESNALGGELAVLYSPYGNGGASPHGLEERIASGFGEIWADLAASSRAGSPLPNVLVLDTRVEVTENQLPLLLSFLMHQGIRLDLWAQSRPASAALTYLSRNTRGNTYYSQNIETVPGSEGVEWIISITLPPETVSFGYPTDATLSLFAFVGAIRFNDWIPIWPALVNRKQQKE